MSSPPSVSKKHSIPRPSFLEKKAPGAPWHLQVCEAQKNFESIFTEGPEKLLFSNLKDSMETPKAAATEHKQKKKRRSKRQELPQAHRGMSLRSFHMLVMQRATGCDFVDEDEGDDVVLLSGGSSSSASNNNVPRTFTWI